MKARPTNIELAGEGALLIEWSDGMRRQYTFRELSDSCPCATCREAGLARAPSPLPIVSLEEPPNPKLRAITPVGNYAYRIEFEGGCTTGIYRLEYLRQLGAEVE
jgi:DUF971 family protein